MQERKEPWLQLFAVWRWECWTPDILIGLALVPWAIPVIDGLFYLIAYLSGAI